jgi:hypothetical protein
MDVSWPGLTWLDPAIHAFLLLYKQGEDVDARHKAAQGQHRGRFSDRLVLREDNVKVTLSLSQRSVTFFKRAARQRRVLYQRMIRALVDAYAEKQEGKG